MYLEQMDDSSSAESFRNRTRRLWDYVSSHRFVAPVARFHHPKLESHLTGHLTRPNGYLKELVLNTPANSCKSPEIPMRQSSKLATTMRRPSLASSATSSCMIDRIRSMSHRTRGFSLGDLMINAGTTTTLSGDMPQSSTPFRVRTSESILSRSTVPQFPPRLEIISEIPGPDQGLDFRCKCEAAVQGVFEKYACAPPIPFVRPPIPHRRRQRFRPSEVPLIRLPSIGERFYSSQEPRSCVPCPDGADMSPYLFVVDGQASGFQSEPVLSHALESGSRLLAEHAGAKVLPELKPGLDTGAQVCKAPTEEIQDSTSENLRAYREE